MKEISGDIKNIVQKIFGGQPPPKDSYRLIPVDANGDNGLVFEILISFLMEALVYLFKGDLNLPQKNNSDDDLQVIFTNMEPYFESIGYVLKVDSKRLIESNPETLNKIAPYRYCKIVLIENDENKLYTFLLNPVPVSRTNLDQYYALFTHNNRAYKISFC